MTFRGFTVHGGQEFTLGHGSEFSSSNTFCFDNSFIVHLGDLVAISLAVLSRGVGSLDIIDVSHWGETVGSWDQLDVRSTHSWASTGDLSRGSLGTSSVHLKLEVEGSLDLSSLLGINSQFREFKLEDTLVGTVKFVLELLTRFNFFSALESEDSRRRSDRESHDFTGVKSDTSRFVYIRFAFFL